MNQVILIIFLLVSIFSAEVEIDVVCGTTPVFIEKNGLIIFEVESIPVTEGWELETKIEGYSGDGYLTWKLPTNTNPQGQGLLAYTFKVTTPGAYTVKIRNYHSCEDFTECNDIFLKMNDTEWRKNFNHTLAEWDWNSRQDVDHVFSDASYQLEEGINTLYLSGRSEDFSIDKIAIFHSTSVESGYKTAELSTCSKVKQ